MIGSGAIKRSPELHEVIQGRRSVRAFKAESVPRSVIDKAILAAGWAPSPHGRQPWRFVVVESPAARGRLADDMAATWKAQLELDGQPDEVVAIRLEKGKSRLRDASVVVVACLYLEELDVYPDPVRQAAEETMAVQSLGAAVQNFLLSIYASGYDAGWMCAPLFCPQIVRDVLGLGAELHPHAMIPVGVAAKDPVRRPRRGLDELVVSRL